MLVKSDTEWQLLDLYKTREKLAEYRAAYIYGAGMVGRKLLAYLNENEFHNKVKSFIVTELTWNGDYINGIEVIAVDEAKISDDDVVILAAKRPLRKEMLSTCQEYGFKNVLEIDVFDDRTEEYYASILEDAYPLELKEWYKRVTGEELNLDNPQTFNEKINWMKLYDRDPRKTRLADKYLVREYVKEKIGEEYLIPLLGVWDKFDDIDFDTMPDKFVLKCNHGSGWNMIVKDKSKFDIQDAKQKFDDWMSRNFAWVCGLELQYKDIVPKIIVEKYLETLDGTDISDYKVFVFSGKAKMLQVDIDRFKNHRRNLYTTDWTYIPCEIHYPTAPEIVIDKPRCLSEMMQIAEKLASDFCHARVDMYLLDGKIYFGEITFTHGSGLERFVPKEQGEIMGNWLHI